MGVLVPIGKLIDENPVADIWSQHSGPPPFNFDQNQQRPDQIGVARSNQNPSRQQGPQQSQNWPNEGQPSFSGDWPNATQSRFQSPDQNRDIQPQQGSFQRQGQGRFDRSDQQNRFGPGPPANSRQDQSPGQNWPGFESSQTFGSAPPDTRTRNRSGNKSWSAPGPAPPDTRTRNRSGNKSWPASGSAPPASQDNRGWNGNQDHSFPRPPPTSNRPYFEERPGNWSDEGRPGFGRSSQGRPQAEFPESRREDRSLKRPHFEEIEPPTMLASKPFQSSGQGSWSSGPSYSAEPEAASASSDTPDYTALMQHLAYYQKQMSTARKGGN